MDTVETKDCNMCTVYLSQVKEMNSYIETLEKESIKQFNKLQEALVRNKELETIIEKGREGCCEDYKGQLEDKIEELKNQVDGLTDRNKSLVMSNTSLSSELEILKIRKKSKVVERKSIQFIQLIVEGDKILTASMSTCSLPSKDKK